MITRYTSKYGEDADVFVFLDADNTSEMDDNNLVRCGHRVQRKATLDLTELTSEGLSQAILDNFKSAIDDFDQAIDSQIKAVNERDISTNDRIKMGNQLYDAIVKVCSKGKVAFENTNEAKYNDYVIHPSSQSNMQNINGTVEPGAINSPDIGTLHGDEEIAVQVVSGTELLAYFSANPFDEPVAGATLTIPFGDPVHINMAQLGFDENTKPRLLFKNETGAVVGYFLQVEG